MLIIGFKQGIKSLHGFSLVELLITLLLGSTLIVMVISLYVTTVSTGGNSLKNSRLHSDLQSIASMIETDIRRAGYSGGEGSYLVGIDGEKVFDINSSNDCIVYYYNHNESMELENSNKMAFRLIDNTVKFKTGVDPVAESACQVSVGWTDVSDINFVRITSLGFTEIPTSGAVATMRSVKIELAGQLSSDSRYKHSISKRVQVRNIEFNQ